MNIDEWLKRTVDNLENASIGTARLDALVLLEDVTGKDRGWLLAHPEFKLTSDQLTKLEKLLIRRTRHEPLAYIRGKTEFYGREFVLTAEVLEPRPESETMIDLFKALPVFQGNTAVLPGSAAQTVKTVHIADVGTGSGALGITAALEVPKLSVELLDIDPKALQVAKTNVDKFTLGINVVKSDLLANASKDLDILLCNLPYVPDDYQINTAATHEPRLAIFGGPDGLDVYRRLFDQVSKLAKQPLYILTEALPPQHADLELIARESDYTIVSNNDFIQVFSCTQKMASNS